MANNNNEGADNNSDSSKDSGLDKSFVGKFVSGLLNNTPLSKWFGKDSSNKSVIRRRVDDEDEDDASYIFQPPVKRAKLPSDAEHNNYSAHMFESPVTVHNASNNINNVSSKVFRKFSEPVAGPSGIKSRKLFEPHNSTASTITVSNSFDNQDIVNGDNDTDSEESTSGYLSGRLVNQDKNTQNTKTMEDIEAGEKHPPKSRSLFTSTNDPNHSRTLFAERSPQMNTSLSSRRPTFNASTFGSPNFIDRTLLTKRIMSSPFYSGNTIYGGASAYGRRLGKSAEELNRSSRVSVQIKPINEKPPSENATLSKTARRILSTLEQYSTPISDAKKIPVTPRKQGILSKYVGASPYLVRDRKRPSNQELQVPSIPELLQMKQKERLQNSTESVRQIATTSRSTLNKEEYKLRTEDGGKQKHSNKMKNNVASMRQKAQPVEMVSDVKLPKVSLPITTLPKFDFVMMQPQDLGENAKSSSSDKAQVGSVTKPTITVEKKEGKIVENGKTGSYRFSEPLVISKDLKSVSAINCFKFSEPVCKKQCMDVSDTFKSTDKNTNINSIKMKNNGENVVKPAGQLVTTSITDELWKKDNAPVSSPDKSKAAKNKWECPTCLVRNDVDKVKCVACEEPKPQSEKENVGFGDKFKLSSDKWECSSCMVRNNNSDSTCVACASAKPTGDKAAPKSGFGDKFKPPASTWECSSCLIRNKNELDKCAACATPKSSEKTVISTFGEKFKPSNDTWECSTCMIRNKNDLNKCQACETLRSGTKSVPAAQAPSFGDKFKPPSETWECPTCMIRNKNDVTKCAACETVKPGQKVVTAAPTFNFGFKPTEWECKTCLIKNKSDLKKCAACESPKDNETEKKGFGGLFKMKEDEWECSSCLVRNKFAATSCACCGVTRAKGSREEIAEINKPEEKKSLISFNFGIDKSAPVQFEFGIPATKSDPPTLVFGGPPKAVVSTSGGFSFGISTQVTSAPAKSITSTTETITSTIVTNPLLKPSEKLPEKAVPAPAGFKFGLDTSLSQKQVSRENIVTSTSKTEAPAMFSGGCEPVKPPATFQFKPAAVNGDINKTKDLPFADKPAESSSNPFSNTATPTPTFKFNAKPIENVTAPVATTTTTSITSQPAEASATLFKFGADTSQPVIPIKKTFAEPSENNVSNGFGSAPKMAAFGSPQAFASTESKPFTFGGSEAPAAAPKNAGFSFGQTEKPPSAANPVFNFGSGPSSSPAGGFNFSVPSGGFNFGGAAKAETQPFSAPPPANIFGTGGAGAKNGSFNFGTNSNNNNQKAIFSFGASQTNQPSFTTQSQAGFNFGASAPQTIPSGGFNFAGAPPSFNFTDGSSATAPPQRKIKKALRRTHR